MANIFFCGCCGGDSKMYAEGRNQGGYRCSRAKKNICWNKATALRKLTHRQIVEAVAAELLAGSGCTDMLCRHIESCLASDEPRKLRQAELSKKISELAQKCGRLAKHVEEGEGEFATLLQLLKEREYELSVARAEFDQLSHESSNSRKLPSREEIGERIQQVCRELLELAPEASLVLQRLLVGPILAVPYRQFGGNTVVLRAEFKINVLGILPADLADGLEGAGVRTSIPTEIRTLVVDLFPPLIVPKNAVAAWGLRKNGVKPKEIERLLGISKRQTTQAVKLGRELEEAKLTDPYIRLTERPATVSRWRSKRPTPLDDDHAAEDAA